jgi:hypothetical protein
VSGLLNARMHVVGLLLYGDGIGVGGARRRLATVLLKLVSEGTADKARAERDVRRHNSTGEFATG